MFERMQDIVGVGKAAREARRLEEHRKKEAKKKPIVFEPAEEGGIEGEEKSSSVSPEQNIKKTAKH